MRRDRDNLCESCGKPAKYFVRRVSRSRHDDGRRLCEPCAVDSERILFGDSGLPMTDLLTGLVMEARVSENDGGNRTKVCPDCGNTANDVQEIGMVGCSMCYKVFRPEIDLVVRKLHFSGKSI